MLKVLLQRYAFARPLSDRAAKVEADHEQPASQPHRSAGCTHVGRVRNVNEDRLLDCAERGLWAVADGMGGHNAGDVAADETVAELRALAAASGPISQLALRNTLSRAHDRVKARTAGRGGTTVVALHLEGNAMTVMWAGDSRAYLVRDGVAQLVTRDHSFVQDLIEAGALSLSQAATHPRANVITRAVGAGAFLNPDCVNKPVRPGDLVILCSDGVSRMMPPANMVPSPAEPIQAFARRLVAEAIERDGSDNASAIVVQV